MLIVPLAALVVAVTRVPRISSSVSAAGGELGRIDLDADRRLLRSPPIDDLGDAGHLRDLLGEEVLGVVVDRWSAAACRSAPTSIMIGESAGLTFL